MNYKLVNNVLGWVVFVIATAVYLLTLEETTSLWDCGEYITTANKLEVGHPPGAPLFMMLGRLFSAFAGPESAAMMVNAMSAICSSASILFLFWTITMLGKKLATRDGEVFTTEKGIAVLGSGLVGALAYTFTDSFWFSAVEGEVYAMSSFFTAIVFWAILKWEVEEDRFQKQIQASQHITARPNRWLIFIAYMIGLSIGVHLLNLLVLPAIGYLIYFKKFKEDLKGFLITGAVSLFTLGFIQAFLIPKIPAFADLFERTFTNSFGLPFNSGFTFFVLILTAALVIGIIVTAKRKMYLMNNIVTALAMLILGYSSFAMIVVRSNANPPLDENNPETLSSLVSYLNRDQYGSWPIAHGPYWNSPAVGGCSEDAVNPAKKSYMKVYAAKVNAYSATLSSDKAKKLINAAYSIDFPLKTKSDGKGSVTVYTPKYKDWVYHDGEYKKPNSAVIADLGEEADYELTFMNEYEYNAYKEKIDGLNAKVNEMGIDFQFAIADETVPKYINVNAGKTGDKKYIADYLTPLPRMYRPGEGPSYMAWVDYHNHEHDLAIPGNPNIPGADAAQKYQYLMNSGVEEYQKMAANMKRQGLYKPNFVNENLAYMFKYQIGWMYLRYFMWNFSGRQNDIQGYGVNSGGAQHFHGNWISGVDMLDSQRLGSQENLPSYITNNTGHNKYYLLPLILGLIGFFFHVVRAPKDMLVVLLLFLLTGLAIVFYLNQKPMEPRERDYAFAASFYAFAIWIGLGVYALFEAFKVFKNKELKPLLLFAGGGAAFFILVDLVNGGNFALAIGTLYITIVGLGIFLLFGILGDKLGNLKLTGALATGIGLVVPIIMGVQNWDDHDRSNRTTARDIAYNYLRSCDKPKEGGKGSIIFTNGDNDTFPLWYIQEVEGVRTDVRVANMSLLGTDWHINQMKRKAYESEPLEIEMNEFSYRVGTRDYVIIQEKDEFVYRSGNVYTKISTFFEDMMASVSPELKIANNKIAPLYAQMLKYNGMINAAVGGGNKNFTKPTLDASTVSAMNTYQLTTADSLKLNQLTASMSEPKAVQKLLVEEYQAYAANSAKWPQVYYSIDEALNFILDDDNITKQFSCNEESYLPFRNIYLDVNKENASKYVLRDQDKGKIVDRMKWSLKGTAIYKSDLAVLDLLSNYNWDRSIYFASQAGMQANEGLKPYLINEGMAFKVTPVNYGGNGGVDIDKVYNLMMDEKDGFLWGNMNGEGVLVDYYTLRSIRMIRSQIYYLVNELIQAGEKQKAKDILDRSFEVMPLEKSMVQSGNDAGEDLYFAYLMTGQYYEAGFEAEGDALAKKLINFKLQEIDYYLTLGEQEYGDTEENFFITAAKEYANAMSLLEMVRTAKYGSEISQSRAELNMQLNQLQQGIQSKAQEIQSKAMQGMYTQEQYNQENQKLMQEFESMQNQVMSEHAKSIADPTLTYPETSEIFEGTEYFNIMARAKINYLKYRNAAALQFMYGPDAKPQNFPQEYVDIWSSM